MKYEFSAGTDCGRVRANNEDTVTVDIEAQMALLADGMGGYNAGEIASQMAVDLIGAEMAHWLAQARHPLASDEVRNALEIAIENANFSIFLASRDNISYSGMGTTWVSGVFFGKRLMLAHVGDSRGYRLRAGQLVQLTNDHSWLQEQIDAGWMTPQQAAQSGHRNLVTRALGVEDIVHVEINEFSVEPQDLYLLCSDGLSEMLSPVEIAALTNIEEPLADKASHLIEAANARGGRDNISVALVQAHAVAHKHGLISRLLHTVRTRNPAASPSTPDTTPHATHYPQE